MAIPQKGSRRIEVDGLSFRWRVRAKPTYSQGLAWSPLTVAVQHEAGGVLVLVFAGARPDNWMGEAISVATPGVVAASIRTATAAGWDPAQSPAAFFAVKTGRLGPSQQSVSPLNASSQSARIANAIWQPYDAEWLAQLAEAQLPEETWLPASLRACTKMKPRNAYIHFVDSASAEWRFVRSVFLRSPEHGELVLDVLEGPRVGGVEFLNRL